MVQLLLALRAEQYAPERPIFHSATGEHLSTRNLRDRVLPPIAEPVGLGWIGFHTFRHAYASPLFAGGKNVKQVQEWLDQAFTLKTYVHLVEDDLGDADFLDEVLAAGAAPKMLHQA